jgi:hypothetical protein
MRKLLIGGGAAILAISMAGILASDGAESGGYFKSDDRNRIKAVRADASDRTEAEAILERHDFWTEGRITAAYLFPSDAAMPGDELTQAGTFGDAVALFASPPFDEWSWRLWINPRGEREIEAREG